MSCWTKEQLDEMMFDVVNELDLSDEETHIHGQNGTAPAELVRLVLEQKDSEIRLLRRGLVGITTSAAPLQNDRISDLESQLSTATAELVKQGEMVLKLSEELAEYKEWRSGEVPDGIDDIVVSYPETASRHRGQVFRTDGGVSYDLCDYGTERGLIWRSLEVK